MLRLIRNLLRPYRRLLVMVVAMSLVQAAMDLVGPWPLKIIMDSVIGNQPVPLWASWFAPMLAHGGKMQIAALAAIIVVATWVADEVALYIGSYFIESVGQRVANDLRMRAYHHLQRLSLMYFQTHQVGITMSTITTDVATIQDFASKGTVQIFVDILTIIGMVIVMFTIRWDFALFAIALLPFLAFFVWRVRGAIAKKIEELRMIQADMVAVAQESLESMEVVEAFELEGCEETQCAQVSRRSLEAALKARRARAMLGPVVSIPIALCYAFMLWRGASLVLSGAMTLGSLTVLTFYLVKFFDPRRTSPGRRIPSPRRQWRSGGCRRSWGPTLLFQSAPTLSIHRRSAVKSALNMWPLATTRTTRCCATSISASSQVKWWASSAAPAAASPPS